MAVAWATYGILPLAMSGEPYLESEGIHDGTGVLGGIFAWMHSTHERVWEMVAVEIISIGRS